MICRPVSNSSLASLKLAIFKSDWVCEHASRSRTRKINGVCGLVGVIRTPDVTVLQGETAGSVLLTDKHAD